jgi:hypothetical protein
MIRHGSVGDRSELTSSHILLELLVPCGRVELGKPLAEAG